MEKSYAHKLVSAYKTALLDYSHAIAHGRVNTEEVDRTESDLLQALTVPNPQEEEFPTVRDLAAFAALQGLLANCWMETDGIGIDGFAKDSYRFADAMMAARKGAR